MTLPDLLSPTNNPYLLLLILGALVILAWLCVFLQARTTGVPLLGRIVAVDQRGWQASSRQYTSTQLGLSGRPDYIIARRGRLIPVEAKPGRRGTARPWDVLQLGAYLLLIEEAEGRRPPYGILAYRDKSFRVRNTRRLRHLVQKTLSRLHAASQDNSVKLSKNRTYCNSCYYRASCQDRRHV